MGIVWVPLRPIQVLIKPLFLVGVALGGAARIPMIWVWKLWVMTHLSSRISPGTPKDMGPPYDGKRAPYHSHIFTWMSMELSNYLVSWVITYLPDLQPTFIGVIIHLLSTMDIQVGIRKWESYGSRFFTNQVLR